MPTLIQYSTVILQQLKNRQPICPKFIKAYGNSKICLLHGEYFYFQLKIKSYII